MVPSAQPTTQPSMVPSGQPTSEPSGQPTMRPSRQPTGQPSGRPTQQPTGQPSRQPTGRPTRSPTAIPSAPPSPAPTPGSTTQLYFTVTQTLSGISTQDLFNPNNTALAKAFKESFIKAVARTLGISSDSVTIMGIQNTASTRRRLTLQRLAEMDLSGLGIAATISPSAAPSRLPAPSQSPVSLPTAVAAVALPFFALNRELMTGHVSEATDFSAVVGDPRDIREYMRSVGYMGAAQGRGIVSGVEDWEEEEEAEDKAMRRLVGGAASADLGPRAALSRRRLAGGVDVTYSITVVIEALASLAPAERHDATLAYAALTTAIQAAVAASPTGVSSFDALFAALAADTGQTLLSGIQASSSLALSPYIISILATAFPTPGPTFSPTQFQYNLHSWQMLLIYFFAGSGVLAILTYLMLYLFMPVLYGYKRRPTHWTNPFNCFSWEVWRKLDAFGLCRSRKEFLVDTAQLDDPTSLTHQAKLARDHQERLKAGLVPRAIPYSPFPTRDVRFEGRASVPRRGSLAYAYDSDDSKSSSGLSGFGSDSSDGEYRTDERKSNGSGGKMDGGKSSTWLGLDMGGLFWDPVMPAAASLSSDEESTMRNSRPTRVLRGSAPGPSLPSSRRPNLPRTDEAAEAGADSGARRLGRAIRSPSPPPTSTWPLKLAQARTSSARRGPSSDAPARLSSSSDHGSSSSGYDGFSSEEAESGGDGSSRPSAEGSHLARARRARDPSPPRSEWPVPSRASAAAAAPPAAPVGRSSIFGRRPVAAAAPLTSKPSWAAHMQKPSGPENNDDEFEL